MKLSVLSRAAALASVIKIYSCDAFWNDAFGRRAVGDYVENPLQMLDAQAQVPVDQDKATTNGRVGLSNAGKKAGLPISPKHSGLSNLFAAVEVMQSRWFEVWLGTWPSAIDWTAAVLGTHVSAALHSFTASNYSISEPAGSFGLRDENLVNNYFAHLTAYYFGEDAFAIRGQAYDDMLWVVLGWLEAIQFIDQHSDAHFPSQTDYQGNSSWYAKAFTPAFAHRARVFWDLASAGWDETLCEGGMIWNPYLMPYKNAITNELFIAASINMYLYFPGDSNDFPFSRLNSSLRPPIDAPSKKHARKYLDAALSGYNWLMDSNMTNAQGLFFDGFHIRGWTPGSDGTGKCDIPDKMVYTYNQGVILSGRRGLWIATGDTSYLEAGHALVRSVIAATGWDASDPLANSRTTWSGLGRAGILEESCDGSGSCSQDGQTFKGIFMHHLSVFCSPLPVDEPEGTDDDNVLHRADRETARLHLQSCREYAPWVAHNAAAAMGTRDEHGRFGMWWTPGLRRDDLDWLDTLARAVAAEEEEASRETIADESEGEDYRNEGVSVNVELWQLPDGPDWRLPGAVGGLGGLSGRGEAKRRIEEDETSSRDPNERGRGRTVEAQSGGLAVLRAVVVFEALEEVEV